MGVTNLWQILSPVQQHRPLTDLKGQTLAVDLSIWICETQGVKQMQGIVSKPFLRNLFFRISYLVQIGVNLVFVVEGDAPELKWEAMMKRQQTRTFGKPTGGRGRGYRGGSKPSRRNFNSCLRECCELLDYLGIPYVQSKGEAEAMCAVLNAAGLVDGCITNDGDAFLYGARTVYRNFTLNSKDPHVESYCMTDIEGQLGLDRDKLVAMALLLGCDYLPKGVPGVGMDKAIKLMTSLQDVSVIKRLHEWKHMTETQCIDQIEIIVRRKALSVPDFPQQKVIDEFINVKDKCPSAVKKWKRPLMTKLQSFALNKLEWPTEYTLEKVLPLVTLWDMNGILHFVNIRESCHLIPNRIVKSRVRQGVPCFEIEWNKPEELSDIEMECLTTVEEREIFSKCFPDVVVMFEQEQENKKTKSKGQKKKKNKLSNEEIENELVENPNMEDMTESFSNIVLSKEEIITKDSNCASSSTLNGCIKAEIETASSQKLKKTKNSISTDKMVESHNNELVTLSSEIDRNVKERQKRVKDNVFENENSKDKVSRFEPIVLSGSSSCSSEDEMDDVYVPLSQRIGRKLKLSSELNIICDKKVETQNENLMHKKTYVTDGIVKFIDSDSVNEESNLNNVKISRHEAMQEEKVSLLDVKTKDNHSESIALPGGESAESKQRGKKKSVLKQENVDLKKTINDNGEIKSNVNSSAFALNLVSRKNEAQVSLTEHDMNAANDDADLVSLFNKSCQIEGKSVLNENKNFLNINVKPLTTKTINRVKNPTAYCSENDEKIVQSKQKENLSNIKIKPSLKTNKVKTPIDCCGKNESSEHTKQNRNLKNVLINDSSISPFNNRSENAKTVSLSLLQKTFSSPYVSQNKQLHNCMNRQNQVPVLNFLSLEENVPSPSFRDKGDIHNLTDFGKLNFSVGTPNMSKFPNLEISPSPSKYHALNESTPSSLRKPEIYYRSPFALQNHVSPVTVSHDHHMTVHKIPSNEQESFQSTGSPSMFSFDKDMASCTFNTPTGSFINEDKSLWNHSEGRSMSEFGKFQIESSLLKSINLTTEETPEKIESKNLSTCMSEKCPAANLETIHENEENMSENMVSNLNFDNLSKSYVFEANFDTSSNSYMFEAKFGFNQDLKAEKDESFNANDENVTPKCDITNPERPEDHFNFDPTGKICTDIEQISDYENQTHKIQSQEEIKMSENRKEKNMCPNQEIDSAENEVCFSFGFSIKGSYSVDHKGNIEVDCKSNKITEDTSIDKDSAKVKTYDVITAIDDITTIEGVIKTTNDLITTGNIIIDEENAKTVANSHKNWNGKWCSKNNELQARNCLGSGISKHKNDSSKNCMSDFNDKENSLLVSEGFVGSFSCAEPDLSCGPDLSAFDQKLMPNQISDVKISNNMSVLNKTEHFLEKENSPVALADRLKRRLQSAGSVKFVLSDITGNVNTCTDNRT